MDELGVRKPVLAGAGVDPLDPERPEVPLALLAPDVGVDPTLPDLLLGPLVRALLHPPVTLGLREDFPALFAGMDATCRAGHLAHPQEALDAVLVVFVDGGLGVEASLALGALLLQDVIVTAPAALELTLLRDFEAPGDALVGLHLRHLSSSTFFLSTSKTRLPARE